jgi:hypothetical protein
MLCKVIIMDIEDRIFELSGETALGAEIVAVIVDEYDIDYWAAWDLVGKVRKERSTPHLASAREAIDRLHKLSYI